MSVPGWVGLKVMDAGWNGFLSRDGLFPVLGCKTSRHKSVCRKSRPLPDRRHIAAPSPAIHNADQGSSDAIHIRPKPTSLSSLVAAAKNRATRNHSAWPMCAGNGRNWMKPVITGVTSPLMTTGKGAYSSMWDWALILQR